MALLFFDGFDHSSTTVATHASKWTTFAVSNIQSAAPFVRTGTGAVGMGQFSSVNMSKAGYSIASGTPLIVGFAFRMGNVVSGPNRIIVAFQEGGTDHIGVSITAGGLLYVYRGTTATVLGTGATVLAANNWYYLELKAVIHDTTGSYELRIDGVTELSASPVDTRNGLTGVASGFVLWGPNDAANGRFIDDLYFCDGSSAIRNDFLGPCKVETMYPQTDAVAAGSSAGLTPSTGTDHGALVDETNPNTTDYNSSATVGLKDTYQYPPLALTGAILGVQTNLYVAKSDAAARTVCAVVRAGGTDYDGATVAPLTSFAYFSEVRAQNPNTSADWTSGEIASLEAGMKITG